jgi:lipid-binding SYLF domain-containing protein
VTFSHSEKNLYKENIMNLIQRFYVVLILLTLPLTQVWADKYQDSIKIFKDAGESAGFFDNSYGYALFPTIAKAGFVLGAAGGEGQVYEQGKYVGDTTMGQISIGLQLGAQGFTQITFFEDKRAFDEFTSGNFEFSADASAVAITAGATASAATTGNSAGASGGQNNANTVGSYNKGMATFTVVKGGLMYEAVLAGQKFSYTAKK